ncbi:unnamed protein product [Brachionus calyciflorus]|uniref:Uncharacterized protein n=1 Tax=Brachionus calyciflorus TaxID=104777 RepID=A0A814N354_9BILA|nr:unnamed protein product [Brachionus calyciflorus]
MEEIDKESLFDYYKKTIKNDINPKKITLKLIMDRNIKENELKDTENNDDKIESKAKKLLELTQIHLDRENIDEIDNLVEYLGDIRNLYLQNNLIRKIENLEFFKNLKFLVLSHNKIEKIENLKQLNSLKLIDLSHNLIENFEIEEFPKSVSFLDLRGNKCVQDDNFTEKIEPKLFQYFIRLIQLNGKDLIDTSIKEFEESKYEESVDSLVERIMERSSNRQKMDVENFEKKWREKKSKLDLLRHDIDEKFNKSFNLMSKK